ncbi:MBL fold metallo-hydrolase [Jatrophihabitans telluris]|uniref:MBL fold metallo-hydrolase n=1 Tax=Jatrophihabitans telluris TaxID=2038343 RepID=A0ABY4R618_9ACTN|nr:MBL fold metallo-hydrolase [Jatrophihabitans telluris]UQX90225.1 MBL fold metallo-hydrolase [Jatrophihabitans telluris]
MTSGPGPLRVDHGVTSGTFTLDGGSWDVDNNVWVVGDESECVVVDAPHDADAIAGVIGERAVLAVLCTHAHDDHVGAARELAERFSAPVRLHPDDDVLWRQSYPDFDYQPLADGETIGVAGQSLQVIHTPGHAPGAVCFYVPSLGALFSGDTLFRGGPGATGRSFSSFDVIVDSLRERVLTLPSETVVHTGHGPDTTIGAEAANQAEWSVPSR